MWAQLTPDIKTQGRRLLLTLTLISLFFGKAILRAWKAVRPTLVFVLNVLAALILLFEEWGWRPLSNLIARLARFPLWAAVERWIAGLPPYGALMTLAVPSAILIPAKFLGVFLLVTGHFVTALAVIILRKARQHGADRAPLLPDQAATDADRLVPKRLRGVRAVAGGAVCAHPQLLGLAVRTCVALARQQLHAPHLG